jgi:hypothetical protein
MERTHNKQYILLIYAALILTTVVAFEPLSHNEFIGYDDGSYVTENPYVQSGLNGKSILWALTSLHGRISYWHPLTWLSHMLDCELFGLNPAGHHLTNLLFHIANALLLFWVLRRVTGAVWQSAFVAAAFALHPLHVESVAWVAERKDVLSGFFWMLTIAAYIRYAERPSVSRYLPVVLAFCMGLMAKPTVVTLPFVLLLLDYWPLERFQWKNLRFLVCEKIPLLLLAAALSVVTFFAQKGIGAVAPADKLGLNLRLANALVSYIRYIGKIFYPAGLAVFYPHPMSSLPLWQPLVCLFILLAVSIAVIYFGRRRRYLPVGWLWYLGVLVPVIGLVQVGNQAMADRYTYLPAIGIFIMLAWGITELLAGWRFRKIVSSAAGLIFIVLILYTRMQVCHWRNNFTLYEHALKVTANNYVAYNNLGAAFQSEGMFDEAIDHYQRALRIRPDYFFAHCNLGSALQSQGRFSEAAGHYQYALGLKPHYIPLNNLAWLKATWAEPDFYDPAEAIHLAEQACELSGYAKPDVLDTLAVAYAAAGDFSKAIETAEKAMELAEFTGPKELARQIRTRLELYKAGQPYIEPAPDSKQ